MLNVIEVNEKSKLIVIVFCGNLSPTSSHTFPQKKGMILASNMDIFYEARTRVTAREAAQRYGLEFNRSGRCKCPFHDDTKPDMSFKDHRYHCFACGASGTSIDLVAHLYSTDPKGAVRIMNDDFHLCLPIDRPPTEAELSAAMKQKSIAESRKRYREWRFEVVKKLNACICKANNIRPPLSDSDFLALQYRERFEELAENLSEDYREALSQWNEVKELVQKILSC